MEKIFEHSKDLHVVGRVIYAKASDAYAYSDSGKTKKIDAETLQDLFEKGCFIKDASGNTYKPVALNVDDGVAIVTYVIADATTATTAVLATLASSEYTDGE
jgi:hypothetical protein